MSSDEASLASGVSPKSKVGRAGVPSRKCAGRSLIRWEHDVTDERGEHRRGDPVLDLNYARTYRKCLAWAANGTEYCGNHGGSAPQTINSAKRVLALAAENAAQGIVDAAVDERLTAADRLKAQAQILDRVGIRAGADISLDAPKWHGVLAKLFGVEEGDEDETDEPVAPETPVEETKPTPVARPAKAAKAPAKRAAPPSGKPEFRGW